MTACSPSPTSTGAIELSGSVSASTVAQRIAAAPAGPVTVRPVQGGSASVTGDLGLSRSNVTLENLAFGGHVTFNPGSSGSQLLNSSALGFDIFGADNIVIVGNTFDGRGVDNQNVMWDSAGDTPDGWRIANNSFSNYYIDDGSHSEALFVGYSRNGLIENNTFTNNGNTGHIFFSWWGDTANSSTSYPRDMCVRGNTFNRKHEGTQDIDFRNEIPVSANLKIDPDQTDETGNQIEMTRPVFFANC